MNTDDRFFIIAHNFYHQINAHDLVVCEGVLDFWCNGSFDGILEFMDLNGNKFRVIDQ